MIKNIQIKNFATYGSNPEELADLGKINFIYGSNGTGKTTISRVIADVSNFPECSVSWGVDGSINTLVYNREFINNNFNQPSELKGIFTLGEKDRKTLDKIEVAKSDLEGVQIKVAQLKTVLHGEDGDRGKVAELKELEAAFKARCWDLKLKHDEKLQGAFQGVRADKNAFKEKLLAESSSNSSIAVPLADLVKKAETVFGKAPQPLPVPKVLNGSDLVVHESNGIMAKKVIGKTDVDIARIIEKLGNSDWVKKGRQFYNPEERVCPFCQQDTPYSLEESLNEYFDETFEADTATLVKLYGEYKNDAQQLQQSIQILLDDPSNFIDAEKIQLESDLLDSKIRINIRRIEDKIREPSKSVELDSLKCILGAVRKPIDEAISEIQKHNAMVSNLASERTKLTRQVWRYLLDVEIEHDLAIFKDNKANLNKAIENLKEKIYIKTNEQSEKEHYIQALERDTTSIQPTIDGINALLQSFGFTGFALAKSERDRFYKIVRPDGSDAKDTLSEGEQSFITFLYFYHLIKGSETESGMTSDRIVVFDDPVSSLDSDILFIVSNLIKGLFEEIRNKSGTIKQVFVLTHNVYFHKEVSFHPKRSADGRLKDESFWTVKKSNQGSKVQRHETNPIKTSYELLWIEVRNPDRDNLAIQNTMRRILEYYFKILGNVDPDNICAHFEGMEKMICRSLFSWVNDGSHFAHDSLYVSIDDSMVENYLSVFKEIFVKTKHMAHYEMMMGIQNNGEMSKTAEQAT